MNPLQAILDDRGINANNLGTMLPAAANPNVYKWANGQAKLPQSHADEIARVLELTDGERASLEDLISGDVRADALSDFGEPTNYIAYAFTVSFREDPEESYQSSLKRFSKAAGISPSILGTYLSGASLIPLAQVEPIADALSPGQPAWSVGGLSWQVAAEDDTAGRFGRLRTDLSNADTLEDIKGLVTDYERPQGIKPMDPSLVLEAIGIYKKDTNETANKIAEGFFLDATYGRIA